MKDKPKEADDKAPEPHKPYRFPPGVPGGSQRIEGPPPKRDKRDQ